MYSKETIRNKYNNFAKWYDLSEGILEFFVKNLRKNLLRKAHGKVLEVGVGTGRNFEYYSRDCEITAIDFSEEMLVLAEKRAQKLGRKISFARMDAENLIFPDNSFDFVVNSFCLCTYVNPIKALKEMVKVCKPDGKILLLEHGRSSLEFIGRWQDKKAEAHAKSLGCYWNREPTKLVEKAGFGVIDSKQKFLGIFQIIKTKPNKI